MYPSTHTAYLSDCTCTHQYTQRTFLIVLGILLFVVVWAQDFLLLFFLILRFSPVLRSENRTKRMEELHSTSTYIVHIYCRVNQQRISAERLLAAVYTVLTLVSLTFLTQHISIVGSYYQVSIQKHLRKRIQKLTKKHCLKFLCTFCTACIVHA